MKKSNLLMSTAMVGLMLASCSQQTAQASDAEMKEVMCHGVNSCKGHGECAGKIDACNGKNGCEASLKCAGMNSCKGKGLKKLSKKECMAKGGKVAKK